MHLKYYATKDHVFFDHRDEYKQWVSYLFKAKNGKVVQGTAFIGKRTTYGFIKMISRITYDDSPNIRIGHWEIPKMYQRCFDRFERDDNLFNNIAYIEINGFEENNN